MKKTVVSNGILNGIKQSSQVLFSLITIPYITRVLGVERYGTINYSNSVVSYFVLLAALGINTYAVREGSIRRRNKFEISKFASEMFSINIISTLIAYLLLFITISINRFAPYREIMLIQSLVIIFNTVGMDWVNVVYEDYRYLTIRYVIIQGLSIIAMFFFVKNTEDYLMYAVISVIAIAGANMLNFIYIHKYIDFKFIFNKAILLHIKPILILFANAVAITIYVNSDITMLGLMKDDYSVGVYSLSSKIYSVIKLVISSLIVVTIPRLSEMVGNNEFEKYNRFLKSIFGYTLVLTVPITVGVFSLSKPLMFVMGGDQYVIGFTSLMLLSIGVLFSVMGYFITNCILITSKYEKQVFIITLIGAIVNIVLNLFFISRFNYLGASITTVFSELIVAIMGFLYVKKRKLAQSLLSFKDLLSYIAGGICVLVICIFIQNTVINDLVSIIISAVTALFAYLVVLYVFKNSVIRGMIANLNVSHRK
ncbi:flippase [Enterococcus sp. DIV1314a]|uniref:flippase n=1 Tax=Enterococcus sp. DIV1314a TaxID=2774660 RepID=UPI003F21C941